MKKILLLILALTLALAGCAAAPASSEAAVPPSVSIAGLQGPAGLTLLKMMEDNTPLVEGGPASTYELLASPDMTVTRLAQGDFDFAALPTNTAAILFNKDTDYRLIAVTTWGNMYILSADSTITSLDDLAGKTVAVSGQGATPDVLLQYYLAEKGLTDKVTLDYTLAAHADLAAALASGQVEVALLPEPFVSVAMAKNADLKIALDMQTLWKEISGSDELIPQSGFVVKGEFADKYPEYVAAFLAQYAASTAYVNTNTADLGALATKHGLTIPPAAISQGTPRSNVQYKSAADAKVAVKRYFTILFDQSPSNIGGKMPDESFFAE